MRRQILVELRRDLGDHGQFGSGHSREVVVLVVVALVEGQHVHPAVVAVSLVAAVEDVVFRDEVT